jgi:hypothetical protein
MRESAFRRFFELGGEEFEHDEVVVDLKLKVEWSNSLQPNPRIINVKTKAAER